MTDKTTSEIFIYPADQRLLDRIFLFEERQLLGTILEMLAKKLCNLFKDCSHYHDDEILNYCGLRYRPYLQTEAHEGAIFSHDHIGAFTTAAVLLNEIGLAKDVGDIFFTMSMDSKGIPEAIMTDKGINKAFYDCAVGAFFDIEYQCSWKVSEIPKNLLYCFKKAGFLSEINGQLVWVDDVAKYIRYVNVLTRQPFNEPDYFFRLLYDRNLRRALYGSDNIKTKH